MIRLRRIARDCFRSTRAKNEHVNFRRSHVVVVSQSNRYCGIGFSSVTVLCFRLSHLYVGRMLRVRKCVYCIVFNQCCMLLLLLLLLLHDSENMASKRQKTIVTSPFQVRRLFVVR